MASSSKTAAIAALMLLSACNLARDLDEVEFVQRADSGATDTGNGRTDDSGGGVTMDTGLDGEDASDAVADLGTHMPDLASPEDMGGSDTGADAGDMGGEPDMGPPPTLSCTPAAVSADVSNPTTVVGNGNPSSCTESALKTALDIGGVVTFNCGANAQILLTDELVIARSVVLDGGNAVTLSGNGVTRVLRVSDVVGTDDVQIQHISIVDGVSNDNGEPCGAGILQDGGSLSLVDVVIARNGCGNGAGGGLATADGFVTNLHEVRFESNSSEIGGGTGGKGQDLTVSDSVWRGNSASDGGGLWSAGQTTLCGVVFEDNSAKTGAGALLVTNDASETIEVDQATIEGNEAMTSGGGIATSGPGTIRVTRSAIVENTAPNGGGIIVLEGGLTIENVTVARNQVTDAGGGIAVRTDGTLSSLNSSIVFNSALSSVGGLLAEGAVRLGNTIIGGNTATNRANCEREVGSLGGNIQFPNPAGDPKCTNDVIAENLTLAIAADGYSYLPPLGSAAATAGESCPADDQLGNPRPALMCAAGSIEP